MKFLKRSLTGVFILLISFICIKKAGIYLLIMNLFITSVAIYELENVLNLKTFEKKDLTNLSINLIFNLCFNLSMYFQKYILALALFGIIALLQLTFYTIFDKQLDKVLNNYLVYLYVSLTFSLMYFVSNTQYIWLMYICSWGTDTAAYCSGMLFGKHKLTEISPKKTIEGAIGGIFGSIIIAIIFTLFYGGIGIIKLIPIVFIGSIISQIGDISASKIKRKAHIKDFGNIFIGHGGVLDRFDSFIFVIPYLVMLFCLNVR